MSKQETPDQQKPLMVGLNHIALEVGNVQEALTFYHKIFNFSLRGKSERMAFLDLGDQFIALFENKSKTGKDYGRHFGLVVDDRTHVRELAQQAGAEFVNNDDLEFYDPWGNRVQIVEYKDIQYTKDPKVMESMGVYLQKTETALDEIAKKFNKNS